MTDELIDLIEQAVAAKAGDKEFVLYRYDIDKWGAYIGNPSAEHVAMLEDGSDFSGMGKTPIEAVRAMISNMVAAKP